MLAVARQQLGYTELPAGSNRTKFGAWYGMDGSAWCAMFLSWCAANSENTAYVPRFAYCPAGAAWFQQRSAWTRSPVVGSIAFYDTAGLGRVSHVGLVEAVGSDGRWYSIEGNTSAAGGRTGGEVRRQLRSTVGTSRGGFGLPRWPAVAAASGPAYSPPALRQGSTGDRVRTVQAALNRVLTGGLLRPLVVDGQFGPATTAAVLSFQHGRSNLATDGVIGPATWAALVQ